MARGRALKLDGTHVEIPAQALGARSVHSSQVEGHKNDKDHRKVRVHISERHGLHLAEEALESSAIDADEKQEMVAKRRNNFHQNADVPQKTGGIGEMVRIDAVPSYNFEALHAPARSASHIHERRHHNNHRHDEVVLSRRQVEHRMQHQQWRKSPRPRKHRKLTEYDRETERGGRVAKCFQHRRPESNEPSCERRAHAGPDPSATCAGPPRLGELIPDGAGLPVVEGGVHLAAPQELKPSVHCAADVEPRPQQFQVQLPDFFRCWRRSPQMAAASWRDVVHGITLYPHV
mmetsp:Transcript_108829/g.306685  ORF Transcript_108829/g.306685 Transcript_108829/m.306685 type:complete len:290 (-) Transcript_108829:588-1457(-)